MSTQKSRKERLATRFNEYGKELPDGWVEKQAERVIHNENGKFWSLYRTLDVSQSGAAELVGPRVDTSQSTVSRVIRQKDADVVYDDEALEPIHGRFEEEIVDALPDEFLEAYKDAVAEAHADIQALLRIHAPTTETPEWAARRFPELVGCHRSVAESVGEEEIADDSHLNRLDSVNTDEWR
jgi:hypothetical protein